MTTACKDYPSLLDMDALDRESDRKKAEVAMTKFDDEFVRRVGCRSAFFEKIDGMYERAQSKFDRKVAALDKTYGECRALRAAQIVALLDAADPPDAERVAELSAEVEAVAAEAKEQGIELPDVAGPLKRHAEQREAARDGARLAIKGLFGDGGKLARLVRSPALLDEKTRARLAAKLAELVEVDSVDGFNIGDYCRSFGLYCHVDDAPVPQSGAPRAPRIERRSRRSCLRRAAAEPLTPEISANLGSSPSRSSGCGMVAAALVASMASVGAAFLLNCDHSVFGDPNVTRTICLLSTLLAICMTLADIFRKARSSESWVPRFGLAAASLHDA
jgi:hypothetical protein